MDVRDDGAGFDPAARSGPAATSGYGLPAMEQRVQRVAGTVTIESAPGEGTAVSASVPAIPAEAEAPAPPAEAGAPPIADGRTAAGRAVATDAESTTQQEAT